MFPVRQTKRSLLHAGHTKESLQEMKKAVVNKNTGEILYVQHPSFKKGDGIRNAVLRGHKELDIKEVELSFEDFEARMDNKNQPIRDFMSISETIKNANISTLTDTEKIDQIYSYIQAKIKLG